MNQPQPYGQPPAQYPPYPPPRRGMNPGLKVAIIVVGVVLGVPFLLGLIGAVAFVFLRSEPKVVVEQADIAKWNKARDEMKEIQKSLHIYALYHEGDYPASLDLITDFPEGVPRDPFTQDHYIYKVTDRGFELTCLGKDQHEGGLAPPNQDIRFTEYGEITD